MFTKYNLFVLCCLILLMKFKEAATSNDTSPPIETSETDKSVTNVTSIISTSNVKPRFVEKEKLSSEGQMKKNKKNITTGTLISLLTSNQSSYTTRTAVTTRENMSKKVESSNIGEENKPDEHDFKSSKPVEPKMGDMKKSEEPNENKSSKPVEPKMADMKKPEEPNENKSSKPVEPKMGDMKKSEEPNENKSSKPVEPKNSEENRSVETQDGRSKHSGNSNTGENKKSEEPSESKPIKSMVTNSDEKKNPREQLDDKSKENTKSKANEETKTKQSQTNINDKFVGSRTSTQSISGNDKSENNKNAADLNKKPDEQSKNINRNQSDIVESSNSHFMVIIFIGLLFTIVAYVVFQKRKKIIAYVIEGRRRNSSNRRTSGSKDTKVSYKPLDTEDKEAGINNYKYVY